MLLSYIVYFGLLIECWIFSYFAEKRNRKLLIWVIILSLTMAAGLRAYSVGLDTPSYVEKFSYIYKGMFSYAYGLEESFKYICYGILHVIPNASFLLGLLALITHACIILLHVPQRDKAICRCGNRFLGNALFGAEKVPALYFVHLYRRIVPPDCNRRLPSSAAECISVEGIAAEAKAPVHSFHSLRSVNHCPAFK